MATLHYRLMERYCISETQYFAMIEAQGGKCYICPSEVIHGSRRARPEVDHNHRTGEVRKILCRSCNQRVNAVETFTPQARHLDRRYERAPYRAYLREHGWKG